MHLNISESTQTEIRLAVAPSGRALLMWQTAASAEAEVGDPTTVRIATAGRSGRFGRPRQLSSDGRAGDVAIRSDGRELTVWTDAEGLHAGKDELITHEATEPRAAFRDGRSTVEWRGAVAVRG
jgi:hypothetical protein